MYCLWSLDVQTATGDLEAVIRRVYRDGAPADSKTCSELSIRVRNYWRGNYLNWSMLLITIISIVVIITTEVFSSHSYPLPLSSLDKSSLSPLSINFPNPPCHNFNNMPLPIPNINTPPTPLPLHLPQHLDTILLKPRFPLPHFLPVFARKRNMLS